MKMAVWIVVLGGAGQSVVKAFVGSEGFEVETLCDEKDLAR